MAESGRMGPILRYGSGDLYWNSRPGVGTLRTLVFTATYNEKGNVSPLLQRLCAVAPLAEVLIVDDDSPDGTGRLLDELAASNPRLTVVHRQGKLGLGSAHQLAMIYAMQHRYDTLVTMDADLSHNPADIPHLLSGLETADFVAGSRYMPGGSCDYRGYRRFVSIAANLAARVLLRLPLHEFTTSFRAFRVEALARINFAKLRNQGYSFFMESIYRLHQAGLRLAEVPIQFGDRHAGDSKIPRFEIVRGVLKLIHLSASRLLGRRMPPPQIVTDEHCVNCKSPYLAERHARQVRAPETERSSAFRCSSMAHASKPRVVRCLQCGLLQVPASEHPPELDALYAEVVDDDYLQNITSKKKTFARAFARLRRHCPVPGRILELGSYCGLFLDEARRNGWQAQGIEPSRWAVQYARQNFGVEVSEGTVEAMAPGLRPGFDAVVSFDVLEHVRDPAAFLRTSHLLLRPGGLLALSTLDADSWFPRLLGARWPWMMEMHLSYFDRGVLARMFTGAGFELVCVEPYRHYASLRYIVRKLCAAMPPWLGGPLVTASRFLPALVVPVSLGDVKLFVGRKR